jgi:hypothetical protein
MRVGWLCDQAGYVGGAELTQAEFRASAPENVEIVDCPPGNVDVCDRYVVHNCVQYTVDDLEPVTGLPTVKFWHDVGPWVHPDVRDWLDRHASPVCCSPIQASYMGLDEAHLIPPPVDVERFAEAACRVDVDRAGVVSVAAWHNRDKAPHRVAEWSVANETPVDFFGGGELAPPGSQDVPYEAMPALLARYETFVYLPTALEPFGRLVAEAWAAGCRVVTNGLVGARYWIDNDPAALETAGDDFWRVALNA